MAARYARRTTAAGESAALAGSEADGKRHRRETRARLEQQRRQRRSVVAKLDRGYDDYVGERIPEEFWRRKSQEWEAELRTVDTERARVERPRPPVMATADKILELAKQAEFLYKWQDPPEQRRLLETVLPNCTFDRGTLCPTYSTPFDLLVRGNETGDWRRGWDSHHCRLLKTNNLKDSRFRTIR